jgi:uncharacterized membrane protein YgdD (TMEM256/DUF423 family)
MASQKRLLIIGGIIGLLGVAIGAFGSHALSSLLEANGRSATFDTGVQYHLIHALALVLVGILQGQSLAHPAFNRAGYFFIAGIIFFSGSLYILSIFNIGIMGAVAPIGGTSFILGWGSIAWGAYKAEQ